MRVHFIIHEIFEAPAAIEQWAISRGHEVSRTHLRGGDPLPSDVEGIDFLVVMGGPQSPATTTEECPHFDAAAEIGLIRKAIDAGKLVLGVCLGAQLMGEALGARFEHSPNREIGAFPLTLTPDARDDDAFAEFPGRFSTGHWHGDMPGLTPDAKILATSEGCPRQIVRYSPKAYGFQCHFEFTSASIEKMIEKCADELQEESQYVQSPAVLRSNDYAGMNGLLFSFLDRFALRR